MPTPLHRFVARLARTTKDVEDHQLQARADELGTMPIGDLTDRQAAEVSGVVRAITTPHVGQVPELVAELYDGSGVLTLRWLGRREIRGIVPGVYLTVTGRVAFRRGEATMFNPSYEIVPRLR